MNDAAAQLAEAREHLDSAEADLLADDSDYHIDEGFGLLEAALDAGGEHASIAHNLGTTYFTRLHALLVNTLAQNNVTEPVLKKSLRVAQALESTCFAAESDLAALRRNIARRLLDKYLEGYSSEEKEQMIQQLMERLERENQRRA